MGVPLPHPAARGVGPRHVRHGHGARRAEIDSCRSDCVGSSFSMATAARILKPELTSAPVPLERRSPPLGPPRPRGVQLAALRAPLLIKLVGANLLVIATLAVAWATGLLGSTAALLVGVTVLSIGHLVLVIIALRPVRD